MHRTIAAPVMLAFATFYIAPLLCVRPIHRSISVSLPARIMLSAKTPTLWLTVTPVSNTFVRLPNARTFMRIAVHAPTVVMHRAEPASAQFLFAAVNGASFDRLSHSRSPTDLGVSVRASIVLPTLRGLLIFYHYAPTKRP